MDDSTINDFVDDPCSYIEQSKENYEFFDGAKNVLDTIDKIRSKSVERSD